MASEDDIYHVASVGEGDNVHFITQFKEQIIWMRVVKNICLPKNLLIYSWALIRHTEHIVMMINEESIIIVNFMTLGPGACARAWTYEL